MTDTDTIAGNHGSGESQGLLNRVRFVLVETTHTGNLGATARAMKTMGLSRLELVRPKHPPDAQAVARASGADDLLERAGVHDDLIGAIADCRLVVGSSARLRSVEWPLLEPPDAARLMIEQAAQGEVALLLGRERSGLTNEELACCRYLVHISTDPGIGSLNVAAAAQVLAYEVRRQWREQRGHRLDHTPREVVDAEAMEGFFGHLAQTLLDIGFRDPEQSKRLLMRLRRLFNRAAPDRVELNILRGILSAAQGRKDPRRFARSGEDSNV